MRLYAPDVSMLLDPLCLVRCCHPVFGDRNDDSLCRISQTTNTAMVRYVITDRKMFIEIYRDNSQLLTPEPATDVLPPLTFPGGSAEDHHTWASIISLPAPYDELAVTPFTYLIHQHKPLYHQPRSHLCSMCLQGLCCSKESHGTAAQIYSFFRLLYSARHR